MVHRQDARERKERDTYARRVELLLVVPDDLAVRADPRLGVPLAQCLLEAVVDRGCAEERALERVRMVLAEHLEEEPAAHLRDDRLVVGEVRDRADGLGDDEDPIGVAQIAALAQRARHVDRHGHAGQIVVDHRGMAEVRRQHDRLLGPARNHDLADLERAVAERAADHDAVLLVGERLALDLRAAQAPVAVVILEDERNRLGDPRVDVQVPQQLLAGHDPLERQRVRHDMERMIPVREQAPPVERLEVRLLAGPLLGQDPGPALGSGRILVDRHRHLPGQSEHGLVEAARDEVARQLPEAVDDLRHGRVGGQRRRLRAAAVPGVLERERVRCRPARGEPRIAREGVGRQLVEGLRVGGDDLVAAHGRRTADAPLARQPLEPLAVRVRLGRGDPDVVEPALLALAAVLADAAREELVEPPRHAADGLDVVAERRLVQADAEENDLSARLAQPREHAVVSQAHRRQPGQQLRRARSHPRDREDRIARADRPRQCADVLRERRERVPEPGDRGRAGRVEGLLPAEGERERRDEDGALRAHGLAHGVVQERRETRVVRDAVRAAQRLRASVHEHEVARADPDRAQPREQVLAAVIGARGRGKAVRPAHFASASSSSTRT
jgi:hypothetical protein